MITTLRSIMDLELLKQELAAGYVVEKAHAGLPDYRLLNYTEKAAYEDHWNEVTLNSRGLIYSAYTGQVIARPFPKFFNLGQCPPYGTAPEGKWFKVYDKMDGSLGIMYTLPDGSVAMATRGSFSSDQAIHAMEILHYKYADFTPAPGLTYLFEIVYPENRIVVDYEGMDDLILLEVLQNSDAKPAHEAYKKRWHGPHVSEYIGLNDLAKLPDRVNKEGFVLYWPLEDKRIKVKHAEYVRLHRILTNISSRSIWDILRHDGNVNEVLENVPDEFYDWVQETVRILGLQFAALQNHILREFQEVNRITRETVPFGAPQREWRKRFAEIASGRETKGYLFMVLDEKPIAPAIWQAIKPGIDKPFKTAA